VDYVLFMLWCFTVAVAGGLVGLVLGNIRLPFTLVLASSAAAGTGALIGLLGGIVGLILGSLRMPALLKVVGERPSRAAGTNLAVGFWVGVFGAIGHLPSEPPDWKVAGLGAAASIPGALIGARLTGRLSEIQLVRAIAGVLLVAAIATGVQAVA
jgi:uncharacterized protein